jgi:hypothetical protein
MGHGCIEHKSLRDTIVVDILTVNQSELLSVDIMQAAMGDSRDLPRSHPEISEADSI